MLLPLVNWGYPIVWRYNSRENKSRNPFPSVVQLLTRDSFLSVAEEAHHPPQLPFTTRTLTHVYTYKYIWTHTHAPSCPSSVNLWSIRSLCPIRSLCQSKKPSAKNSNNDHSWRCECGAPSSELLCWWGKMLSPNWHRLLANNHWYRSMPVWEESDCERNGDWRHVSSVLWWRNGNCVHGGRQFCQNQCASGAW